MYRAIALAAVRSGLNWNDPDSLTMLAQRVVIQLRPDKGSA